MAALGFSGTDLRSESRFRSFHSPCRPGYMRRMASALPKLVTVSAEAPFVIIPLLAVTLFAVRTDVVLNLFAIRSDVDRAAFWRCKGC